MNRILKFNDDVRGGFEESLDITNEIIDSVELLISLSFNKKTKWPKVLPKEIAPDELLERGMTPPLGITDLHKNGINGFGVKVAIIDQPLYLNHPQYAGKIVKYKDFDTNSNSSMHGPAVTSLLVGKDIGTAPGAKVYYASVPSWKADSEYYAKALDWIIEENKLLSDKDKIRVVSVSAAPSGLGSLFKINNDLWDISYQKALDNDIMVLDCTKHHGIAYMGSYNILVPTENQKVIPIVETIKNKLIVPTEPRTTAEHYEPNDPSYVYYGQGGLSFGIPYLAGVFALAWQVNPNLKYEELIKLVFETADDYNGFKIINPKQFINEIISLSSAHGRYAKG
jgi:subtilisin family serine protease